MNAFLTFPMSTTCPVHLATLDFIILIILGVNYNCETLRQAYAISERWFTKTAVQFMTVYFSDYLC